MPKKKAKKPGRPKTGQTPPRSIRVTDEMWERWKVKAGAKGVTAWIVERCEK